MPAASARPAEHRGGQQAGADGDHYRDEAVERRQAVGEGVQVALQALALQVRRTVKRLSSFSSRNRYTRVSNGPDRDVGGQHDAGAEYALAGEGDAIARGRSRGRPCA